MAQEKIYDIPSTIKKSSSITAQGYEDLYKKSIEDPNTFWEEQAKKYLQWDSKWTDISEEDFSMGKISWFKEAKLNTSVNCIDRHLNTKKNTTAIIWESDDPDKSKEITYEELTEKTEDVLSRIAAFIEIPSFSTDLHKRKWVVHGLESKIQNMNFKSIENLTIQDINSIEVIAQSTLSKYGYKPINKQKDLI